MALGTPTSLTSGSAVAAGTTEATASFTPTAGSLLVVFVFGNKNPDMAAFSIANSHAGAWSWQQATVRNETVNPSDETRLSAFWAVVPASPGAGTVTFTCLGGLDVVAWRVVQVTSTGTPRVAQSKSSLGGGTTSASVVLDSAPGASSVVVGGIALYEATGTDQGAISPGAGWTELAEAVTTGNWARLQTQYDTSSASQTVAWTLDADWDQFVALAVEIVETAAPSTPSPALTFGVVKVEWAPTSEPFATDPTWVDITAKINEVRIRRGRSGTLNLYEVGTCTISFKNNNTPTVDPSVWYRWRQVRVTATTSTPAPNVLFRGFVSQTVHNQSEAPFVGSVTLECVDLLDILARFEYGDSGVPEETTGERAARVAADMGVPAMWRGFATGVHHMAEPVAQLFGVDTPGLINVNALQHLQDCAEAEVGGLYVSAAGVLTFEDRHELLERIAAGPLTVFSNTPAAGEASFLRGHMPLAPPGTDYRNRVTFTGASGMAHTEENVPSGYPPDSLSRTLPMSDDNEADANAILWLEVLRQSPTWPVSIAVPLHPGFTTNLNAVTGLDLRRYATVEFTPVGMSQQTYPVIVESIEHTIGQQTWTCVVGFSSAERWTDAWGDGDDYFVLDTDVLDGGALLWP